MSHSISRATLSGDLLNWVTSIQQQLLGYLMGTQTEHNHSYNPSLLELEGRGSEVQDLPEPQGLQALWVPLLPARLRKAERNPEGLTRKKQASFSKNSILESKMRRLQQLNKGKGFIRHLQDRTSRGWAQFSGEGRDKDLPVCHLS